MYISNDFGLSCIIVVIRIFFFRLYDIDFVRLNAQTVLQRYENITYYVYIVRTRVEVW